MINLSSKKRLVRSGLIVSFAVIGFSALDALAQAPVTPPSAASIPLPIITCKIGGVTKEFSRMVRAVYTEKDGIQVMGFANGARVGEMISIHIPVGKSATFTLGETPGLSLMYSESTASSNSKDDYSAGNRSERSSLNIKVTKFGGIGESVEGTFSGVVESSGGLLAIEEGHFSATLQPFDRGGILISKIDGEAKKFSQVAIIYNPERKALSITGMLNEPGSNSNMALNIPAAKIGSFTLADSPGLSLSYVPKMFTPPTSPPSPRRGPDPSQFRILTYSTFGPAGRGNSTLNLNLTKFGERGEKVEGTFSGVVKATLGGDEVTITEGFFSAVREE